MNLHLFIISFREAHISTSTGCFDGNQKFGLGRNS